MSKSPESEILAKLFADMGENYGEKMATFFSGNVMSKSPESEILAKFFADMGENYGEKMAKFFADFRLQFPGKVGARYFTKKWQQIRLAVK